MVIAELPLICMINALLKHTVTQLLLSSARELRDSLKGKEARKVWMALPRRGADTMQRKEHVG